MSKLYRCAILTVFAAFTFPGLLLANTISARSVNSRGHHKVEQALVVTTLAPSSPVTLGSGESVLIMNPGGRIFSGALALDRTVVLADTREGPGGEIILTAHPFGQLRRLLSRGAAPTVRPLKSDVSGHRFGGSIDAIPTVTELESGSGGGTESSGANSSGINSIEGGGPALTPQEVATVPEPSSLILLISGIAALGGYVRARGNAH